MPASRQARRPLVVISNRLPYTTEKTKAGTAFKRSAGGLVSALDPALEERGGVWLGWAGVEQEGAESAAESIPPTVFAPKVRIHPVSLSKREVSLYYGSFSNRTLWPLFHYFIGHTQINEDAWHVYDRVNYRFAEEAARTSSDDALMWVHDYQLMRVPRHLRRVAPRRAVGFFLHTPFPAYEVFRILPWSRQLMRGVLSADLVGLQVPQYVEHFMDCAERLLGCTVDREAGLVRFGGYRVAVQAHPIGIAADHFESIAAELDADSGRDRAVRHVLSVDRLDYTKGIPHRLRAIERLFERYPNYRGRVAFVQVAVPSRTRVAEYRALKREIDETVGRINGRFSTRGWAPIRYLVRSISQAELIALYRHSDIGLVTPLRDGMNLVAKEYIASQEPDGGVLILSELAGAANELQEALLVNPFDEDAVAEALHRALSMSQEERRVRLATLRDRVRDGNVKNWAGRFLRAVEQAAARTSVEGPSPADSTRSRLEPWLAERPAASLFFDYDGTLTPIRRRPEEATLSEAGRDALLAASMTPNLDIIVVSGRALDDVRRMVGVPGLIYVGNHGFEIDGPGISFRHEGLGEYRECLDEAARRLEEIEAGCAWVERKGATVTLHYREVPHDDQADVARRAAAVFRRLDLDAIQGKAVVEGRPPISWNKGSAVLFILNQRHGAQWPARVRALYVGDDRTDEDAFRALRGIGRSVRVGPTADTAADLDLPDPESVLELLRWLAAGAFLARER